jgi:hypothetical protein
MADLRTRMRLAEIHVKTPSQPLERASGTTGSTSSAGRSGRVGDGLDRSYIGIARRRVGRTRTSRPLRDPAGLLSEFGRWLCSEPGGEWPKCDDWAVDAHGSTVWPRRL